MLKPVPNPAWQPAEAHARRLVAISHHFLSEPAVAPVAAESRELAVLLAEERHEGTAALPDSSYLLKALARQLNLPGSGAGTGWHVQTYAQPQDIARDWQELQEAMREAGKDPKDTLVAHENFLHLVMTNDPQEARRQQHEAFLKVMSNERGPDYLESVYLFGTPDEIIASLQARVDAGVEYFFLHTMTPDPGQLQLWVDHIIPNVHFPATAGPVRRPPTPWRR